MSIQNYTIKNNLKEKLKNYILILKQIIYRFNFYSGVFFRYKTLYTHPTYNIYYTQSPIKYTNYFNSSLYHWVNYPKNSFNKNYIIEINDHPLSVIYSKYKISEPYLILEQVNFAKSIYSNPKCVQIIMTCEGVKNLFNFYFGNDLDEKILFLPQPGCYNINEINFDKNNIINFLCLASDYYSKGVDLVIKSWVSIQNKKKSVLHLACPNIPLDILETLKNFEDIVIHKNAPLNIIEKHKLFSETQVLIASTHIHGGANIYEAMSYGQAIISFEYHLNFFNKFSKIISMPYYFYKPDFFGIKWKTFNDFYNILSIDKNNGVFNESVELLSETILFYINNPSECYKDGKIAYDFSISSHSYIQRNLLLYDIYTKHL
jgi:hypothetical protein